MSKYHNDVYSVGMCPRCSSRGPLSTTAKTVATNGKFIKYKTFEISPTKTRRNHYAKMITEKLKKQKTTDVDKAKEYQNIRKKVFQMKKTSKVKMSRAFLATTIHFSWYAIAAF